MDGVCARDPSYYHLSIPKKAVPVAFLGSALSIAVSETRRPLFQSRALEQVDCMQNTMVRLCKKLYLLNQSINAFSAAEQGSEDYGKIKNLLIKRLTWLREPREYNIEKSYLEKPKSLWFERNRPRFDILTGDQPCPAIDCIRQARIQVFQSMNSGKQPLAAALDDWIASKDHRGRLQGHSSVDRLPSIQQKLNKLISNIGSKRDSINNAAMTYREAYASTCTEKLASLTQRAAVYGMIILAGYAVYSGEAW